MVLSIVISIFKGNNETMRCRCYRTKRLFEHGTKVVKRIMAKICHKIFINDETQIGYKPQRGTIDAAFIKRKLQEEYHVK